MSKLNMLILAASVSLATLTATAEEQKPKEPTLSELSKAPSQPSPSYDLSQERPAELDKETPSLADIIGGKEVPGGIGTSTDPSLGASITSEGPSRENPNGETTAGVTITFDVGNVDSSEAETPASEPPSETSSKSSSVDDRDPSIESGPGRDVPADNLSIDNFKGIV